MELISSRGRQFGQTQPCDQPLLLGGISQFGLAIVIKPRPKRGQDLTGAFSAGANDKDKSEPFIVDPVGIREFAQDFSCRRSRSGLFFFRRFGSAGLTDAWMGPKCFEPISNRNFA